MVIIAILVVLNVLVFIAWQMVSSEMQFNFMAENFLVSWNALVQGRPWTLITSVFSHNAFYHILLNMIALISFGRIMVKVLGKKKFIIFYLIAGIVGSLVHSLVSLTLIGDPSLNALGASGAICGVILLFSLIFPLEKILIMGIIPIRSIWGALLLVGLDIWGVIAQSHGGGFSIGHGAHLGGAMVGVVYYFILRSKVPSTDNLME